MSLKELSRNLQREDEFHTFVKSERVIRRPLSLHHLHKDMADIIRSHKYEEERKSNVQAYMTNYFLHKQHVIVNDVKIVVCVSLAPFLRMCETHLLFEDFSIVLLKTLDS